jgi:uncharacterized protein YqhQ
MSGKVSQIDDRTQYGGQAVVEGVMMRSPRHFAIACRLASSHEIVVKCEPVADTFARLKWLNKPLLRGSLALVDAMAMGIKALTYSANVQMIDEANQAVEAGKSGTEQSARDEAPAAGAASLAMGEGTPVAASAVVQGATSGTISGIAIGATTVISLCLGFGLFWVLPGLAADHWMLPFLPHASAAEPHSPRGLTAAGQILVNLFEGAVRLAIFFAYLGLISRMAHIQRVFQYHGAEHKAINTLEAGLPITLENARAADRIHPRCGTNFIFIVLMTAILVFSVIPRHGIHEGLWLAVQPHLMRLLMLPVVAGIAYEILKFAGKHRDKSWARAMVAPGLWTQYLTTRVPDDSQIEVAIAALQRVLDKEHEDRSDAPTDEPVAAVA